MTRVYTDDNGRKRPITTKGSRGHRGILLYRTRIQRGSDKLTTAAKEFISKAISERRHKHPEESQAQSVAIAHDKARKAGYNVPEVSRK